MTRISSLRGIIQKRRKYDLLRRVMILKEALHREDADGEIMNDSAAEHTHVSGIPPPATSLRSRTAPAQT